MREVPIDKRFRGSARLVTLHLWRVGKSTDLDECFAKARELGMLSEENEAFIRQCLDVNDALERGHEPSVPVNAETVAELQKCALRLNAADPA